MMIELQTNFKLILTALDFDLLSPVVGDEGEALGQSGEAVAIVVTGIDNGLVLRPTTKVQAACREPWAGSLQRPSRHSLYLCAPCTAASWPGCRSHADQR